MSANAHREMHPDGLAVVADTVGQNLSQRRVLLIDEQAHVLRVMRLNLDRHGYEVDTALSSEHALLLMQQQAYDALIMTSDMPDMSTRHLCESAIRDGQKSVRMILVSSSGSGDDSWIDNSAIAERLDRPVSLRWIVARLSEEFGDFTR